MKPFQVPSSSVNQTPTSPLDENTASTPKTLLKHPTNPFPSSFVTQTPITPSADDTASTSKVSSDTFPPKSQETTDVNKTDTSIEVMTIKADSGRDNTDENISKEANLAAPIVEKDVKEVTLSDSGCDLDESKKEESISLKEEKAFENSKELEKKAFESSEDINHNGAVEVNESNDHNLLKGKSDLIIDQRLSEFDEVLDKAEKSLGDGNEDIFTNEMSVSSIDKEVDISKKKLCETESLKHIIKEEREFEDEKITKKDELVEDDVVKNDNDERIVEPPIVSSVSVKTPDNSNELESPGAIMLGGEPSEKKHLPSTSEIELKNEEDKNGSVVSSETKIEFIEITSKVCEKDIENDAILRSKSMIHDPSKSILPSMRLTSTPITLNDESMKSEVFISDKSSPIDSNEKSLSVYECSATKTVQVHDVTNSLNDEKTNELNQNCTEVEGEVKEKTEVVEVSFEVTDELKEKITQVDENVSGELSEIKTEALVEVINENPVSEGGDESSKRPQLGKFEVKSADRASLLYQKDFMKPTKEKDALDNVEKLSEVINEDKDSEKDEATCNKVKSSAISVKPSFVMKKTVSVVEEANFTASADNNDKSSERSKSIKNAELTHSVSESHDSYSAKSQSVKIGKVPPEIPKKNFKK